MTSWYQTSRPSCIVTSSSARRRTTTTFSIDGQSATAASVVFLSGTMRAAAIAAGRGDDELRLCVLDAVVQRVGGEAAEDDGVHAPMRAQASIATTASAISGM